MLFLAILVVVAAVAAALAGPLMRRSGPEGASEEVEARKAALDAKKEAKYREILDAEADFKAGKLSEDDYRALDRELRRDAVAILRDLDGIDAGRASGRLRDDG